ncbi:CVNH domain-containing protein [Aspergillus chevalieri]|uniref:Cyanovirin-N domain-containing protein n=1 Tax=Aspergillus chevalieri TaxID=182096 RepID=A0A7R7VNJ8_ASPCH|nr:uncharacterized protein ACHE_31190A [Aspergillus chevalieri]BCR87203.1 hypothetical protein ACHE_31190A [Aspergillus chevalieri]
MSFSQSSDDIRIEFEDDATVLYAVAADAEGNPCDARIVLDDEIGNSDGWFTRSDSRFTESSQEIRLDFREDGVWLVGHLPCADGSYREDQGINLDKHIGNNNGELIWIPIDCVEE